MINSALGGLPEPLQNALQEHENATSAICDSFVKGLESNPIPSIIYHYTDDGGLRGILESGKLWFTDLFDLNDPSEFLHGMNLAFDALESQSNAKQPEVQEFYTKFRDALTPHISELAHYFVCCFSRTDADLGQWRAYADDGKGYAIGFDNAVLEEVFERTKTSGSKNSTFPVTYDDKQLTKMHRQLVEATTRAILTPYDAGCGAAVINAFLAQLAVNLAETFFLMSSMFKHEAYRSEAEYRFLETFSSRANIPALKLRNRPYSLVRYRTFDWKSIAPKAIKEIVCGPANDPSLSAKFAHDCQRQYAANNPILIKHSKIPYRSVRP